MFSHSVTELIEILSSDEDVKVLSESERDEQSDAEFAVPIHGHEEESGTHTDDTINQPDEEGRVLVNVGHPLDEQDLYLPPHLACKVKSHQVRVVTITVIIPVDYVLQTIDIVQKRTVFVSLFYLAFIFSPNNRNSQTQFGRPSIETKTSTWLRIFGFSELISYLLL